MLDNGLLVVTMRPVSGMTVIEGYCHASPRPYSVPLLSALRGIAGRPQSARQPLQHCLGLAEHVGPVVTAPPRPHARISRQTLPWAIARLLLLAGRCPPSTWTSWRRTTVRRKTPPHR